MSRILIYDARGNRADWLQRLEGESQGLVVCGAREAMLNALAGDRPDALIYVLGDLPLDLGVLRLVRRIAPALPIIVLGGPTGLEARRRVQDLRPVYFGFLPPDAAELREAVRGALGHESPVRPARAS